MSRIVRPIVIATPALAAVAFWRPLNDAFSLPKATIVVVGALVVVVAASVELLRRPVVVLRDGRVVALLVAVAAVILVSTLLAGQPVQALVGHRLRYAGGATYLAGIVLCLAAGQCFDERAARALAWALVVAAGVVAGYTLLQLRGSDLLEVPGTVGAVATMGNIDFVSGWLAVALPLAAWAAIASRRDILALAAAGVGLAIVIALVGLRVSQGPVAGGAGLAVVLGAWAADRGFRLHRRHVLAIAAVVAVVLVGLLPRARAELDSSLSERRFFWSAAISDVGNSPLPGHGLDTFGDRFLRLRSPDHARTNPSDNAGSAHDVPLDVAIGGGLPLLGLYLAVVVATGRRLARGLRTSSADRRLLLAGIGGGWVAYQVESLVSINLPALAVAHWVLTGAVLALTAGPARERQVPRAMPLVAGLVALAALVPSVRPLRAEMRLADAITTERRGRMTASLVAYRAAASLAPWEPIYLDYLAVRTPDPESIDAAVRAAELSPGDPYAASHAADAAAAVGDTALERRWREAAVHDDPWNPRWKRR